MSGTTGESILVTGALGQIGRDLVEALRDKHGEDAVIASDVREVAGHPFVEEGRFVRLSVLDGDAMDAVVEDEEVGTIYHLAAILSATGEQNPDLCERVNVGGTITVLEAARRHDLRVYAPPQLLCLDQMLQPQHLRSHLSIRLPPMARPRSQAR